jgi:UV DNA damage repair endonuclease
MFKIPRKITARLLLENDERTDFYACITAEV